MRFGKVLMAGLLMAFGSVASAAPEKIDNIGYVDLQKALEGTKAGRNAKKTLTTEMEEKKTMLQKRQEELKALREDFEKKSMVMNEKTRQEKEVDFQKKVMEFQELVQKNERTMVDRQKELTQPILDSFEEILEEIASEKGLKMILEKNRSAILFAPRDTDFTETLITKYEARAKKKK